MINKLTNSSAADGRICSFLLLRCSVVVTGTEGRYLWSAVVGGGMGELFLSVARDVGYGCWRRDGGKCKCLFFGNRRPNSLFVFLCCIMGIRRGGGDGFCGVPLLALSLARDDVG